MFFRLSDCAVTVLRCFHVRQARVILFLMCCSGKQCYWRDVSQDCDACRQTSVVFGLASASVDPVGSSYMDSGQGMDSFTALVSVFLSFWGGSNWVVLGGQTTAQGSGRHRLEPHGSVSCPVDHG